MRVELAKLKPNPFVDTRIDPIDEEAATRITASITESGFWGGAALRKDKNGDLEIACGRTRIYAAIAAGVTHADLHIGKYSDAEMIRVYANENLTQRGEIGLAMAGAVASAVRYLVKGLLQGDKHVAQICTTSKKGSETVNGQLASPKGLGHECVLRFFDGVPGMHESSVTHHLANLKSSGEYARIVKEVTEEIATEQADEQAELERREKEAEEAKAQAAEAKRKEGEAKAQADAKTLEEAEKKRKEAEAKQAETQAKVEEKAGVRRTRDRGRRAVRAAASRPITFDLVGVGKFLKTEHQIRVFRKIVEREKFKKHVPVKAQAKLAALLVKWALKFNNGELTASFIENHLTRIIDSDLSLRKGGELDLELSEAAQKEIEHEQAQNALKNQMHDFSRKWGWMMKLSHDIIKLKDDYPDLRFEFPQEFRLTLKHMVPTINELVKKLNIKL